MRKIIIMALVLMLSMVFVYADSEPSPWAETEVEEARSTGLVVPEANTNFRTNISREVFCKLIVNMVEKSVGHNITINIQNPFVDVNDTAVTKAYQLGIVNGTSATTFSPNANINRQEISAMMMRAFRKLDELKNTTYTQNIDVSGISFADQSQISSWALNDIKELYKLGLMRGVGGNKISPLGPATTEQSILLTSRLYKKILELSRGLFIPEAMVPRENVVFRMPHRSVIEVSIDDLVTGAGNNAQIVNVYTAPAGIIAPDRKSFRYIAKDVSTDTTFMVSAKLVQDGIEVTAPFAIVVERDNNNRGLFEVDEGETLMISIDDLVHGIASDAEIVRCISNPPQISITPDRRNIQYVAELRDQTATHGIGVVVQEKGVEVPLHLSIRVNDLGTLAPIENQMFTVNGGEEIMIPIGQLVTGASPNAKIIGAQAAEQNAQRIGISPDQKFVEFEALNVGADEVYHAQAKISDGDQTINVDFEIKALKVSMQAKQNLVFNVREGEEIVIPIDEFATGIPLGTKIIGAQIEAAAGPGMEISPSKKSLKFRASSVNATQTYSAQAKLSGAGQTVISNFKIKVINFNPPKKNYTGDFYDVNIGPGEYNAFIPTSALVTDADTPLLMLSAQVIPFNSNNPANITCEYKKNIMFPAKTGLYINVPVPAFFIQGTSNHMTFKVLFSDGTDSVSVMVRVLKGW